MRVTVENAPIVFIMGPTASGKTALAIELYQNPVDSVQYEIISVDSAMVFTQMDIGSAKPNDKELALAPHHLIDFVDPADSYSVANFRQDAITLINQIHRRNRVPLLVGGTMMYYKALKDGLAEMPSTSEPVRQQVKALVTKHGLHWLHQQLGTVDPDTASRLHVNDSQRITRAYEVYLMTDKPLSQWHAEQKLQSLTNPLLSIALAPSERSVLHRRIEQRFKLMVEAGFLEEVEALHRRGDLNLELPSMRCVGYRQIWQYLEGELSLEEAIERAI
ncbi:MAG: tRNA (adenosine(37)-N6)-dimethylallyltransferase MiaA, partial [Lentilitoribacter sp.]